VRTECDALYDSAYEPWSRYLTSIQGKYPGYDPLEFALEETHKRGMELHAWMNPYRVNVSTSDGGNYYGEGHVYLEHPEWILDYSELVTGGKKILNPGNPEVQQYIKEVVGDLISKYDIDGIHFDDYFYAYGGTNNLLDQEEFDQYSTADETRGDFRRRSINQMVEAIWDTIQITRPYIRFGISPFGIYGNGTNPPGIVGLDAYNVIYCDPLAWLEQGTVDYINPQLYWPTGGGQDFATLLPWWAEKVESNEKHVFAGHGIYRLSNDPGILEEEVFVEDRFYQDPLNLSIFEQFLGEDRVDQWNLDQVITQIDITREHASQGALGSVFFRANDFNRVKGLKNKLKENVYEFPSVYPPMIWKNVAIPSAPTNFKWIKNESNGCYVPSWSYTHDSIRFSIYESENDDPVFDAAHLLGITYDTTFQARAEAENDILQLAIKTLDRTGLQSDDYLLADLNAPEIPELIFPEDGFELLASSDTFRWESSKYSSSYEITFSLTEDFSNIIGTYSLSDTLFGVENKPIIQENSFFWRVNGKNLSGNGPYSETRYVETALPLVPDIIYPTQNATEVALMPEFVFSASGKTDSVHIQISRGGSGFAEYRIFLDTTIQILTDEFTFIPEDQLEQYTTHYMRIQAINLYGNSLWSEITKFKTLMPVPGTTSILAPLNEEIYPNLTSEINISWSELNNASSYIIQIADDQDFNDILLDKSIFNEEEYVFQSPLTDNWHFIRVAGKNVGGIGEWSNIVKFGLGDPSSTQQINNRKNKFLIYPNPSDDGFINIEKIDNNTDEHYQLVLMNTDGGLVLKQNFNLNAFNKHLHLDLTNFYCMPCLISIYKSIIRWIRIN